MERDWYRWVLIFLVAYNISAFMIYLLSGDVLVGVIGVVFMCFFAAAYQARDS